MPLVPAALAQQMLGATQNAPDASVAMLNLGNAIGAYIMANAQIQYLYNAMIPAPPPAPPIPVINVPGMGMLTAIVITLSPSMANAPGAGLVMMAQQIHAGIMASMQQVMPPLVGPPSPVAFPPLVLSVAGPDRIAAFNMIAAQICTWLISAGPALPPVSGVTMPPATLPPLLAKSIAIL